MAAGDSWQEQHDAVSASVCSLLAGGEDAAKLDAAEQDVSELVAAKLDD